MAILDLGTGGGRTSAYLSQIASRYVGVDYAPEMIRICRNKFPHLEYFVTQASNLSLFEDACFDAVVMCFNVLDDVIPDEKRRQCLRECHRILGREGILIFSSHNPRAIVVRPQWNREKVLAAAREHTGRNSLLFPFVHGLLVTTTYLQALSSAMLRTLQITARYATKLPFWQGEGHMLDCSRESTLTHFSIPRRVISELNEHCFRFVAIKGDDYPLQSHSFVTGWYYYVFSKAKKNRDPSKTPVAPGRAEDRRLAP
jgi:SAM-dependent methyltransferase